MWRKNIQITRKLLNDTWTAPRRIDVPELHRQIMMTTLLKGYQDSVQFRFMLYEGGYKRVYAVYGGGTIKRVEKSGGSTVEREHVNVPSVGEYSTGDVSDWWQSYVENIGSGTSLP